MSTYNSTLSIFLLFLVGKPILHVQFRLLALFAMLLLSSNLRAQEFACVPNQGSNSVSIINTTTDNVVATVSVSASPHYVAVNPSGTFGYVTHEQGVSAINLATNTATLIASLPNCTALAVSPDGTKVYVGRAALAPIGGMTVLGVSNGSVVSTTHIPFNANSDYNGIAVSPNGEKVYAGVGTQVKVISTLNFTLESSIDLLSGGFINMMAIKPDGSRLYLVVNESQIFFEYNTITNTLGGSIDLASVGLDGATGLCTNLDGSQVYVTGQSASQLAVINTSSLTVDTVFSMGYAPMGVAIHPDGTKLYIANRLGNYVSVVNTNTYEEDNGIGVGNAPWALGNMMRLVYPSAPEIGITGNNVEIVDGDNTPSLLDYTDFGNVGIGNPQSRTFRIHNTGTSTLSLGTPNNTNTTVFAISSLPSSVAPNSFIDFTITFNPLSLALESATITINNGDSNEASYDFVVKGTGATPSSEINITGNNVTIADGDNTPSTLDYTDFGIVSSVSPLIRTFRIHNTGTGTLSLGTPNNTNTTEFTISPLPSSVAPNSFIDFTITFNATSSGIKNATITINNGDNDEDVYDFVVRGIGLIPNAFVTTWITDNGSITIPTNNVGYTYNYDITWTNVTNVGIGNGSATGQTGNYDITNLEVGSTYIVSIVGTFPRFYMQGNATNKGKIRTIIQWGNQVWGSMAQAFEGCTNLTYAAMDNPNLSVVTRMDNMFMDCNLFNGNISTWNVGNVTNMTAMFYGATSFNQPLDTWNVGNITNMAAMFYNATSFNQPLNTWNVSNVADMQAMFHGATSFNQPLNTWNVSNVADMHGMFQGATSFNQPLGTWNVGNVTDMNFMFFGATSFNQPLGTWDVENVTNLSYMFVNATSFNQSLNTWNVVSVTNMSAMFAYATSFNQPLGTWNVTNVTNMGGMFDGATSFNQNLITWNVGNVTNMSYMFRNATSFNQPLGTWNVGNVTNMFAMLNNCGMSKANYDNTLTGWASQTVKPNLTLGASGLKYCAGQNARNILTSMPNNWSITGDAIYCPEIKVKGNSVEIVDGDSWPSTADDTDFGTVTAGSPLTRTFEIHNTGTAPLVLGAPNNTNPTNFTISSLPAQVAAGGMITFTVTFNATSVGTKNATITINNDDSDESAYDFAVMGTITLPPNAFVTTWITNDGNITIPTNTSTGTYNYNVVWNNLTNAGVGNGSATGLTGNHTIAGLQNGSTYLVSITGTFPHFYMGNGADKTKLMTIAQWGNQVWKSMGSSFAGCSNLTYSATDAPNLSNVVDMSDMFSNCINFNGAIGSWNTSSITYIAAMFRGATSFNQPIGTWNMSNVGNVAFMFEDATSFNQPIGTWNVGGVTEMFGMFRGATVFNQDISAWNVSSVNGMGQMFSGATAFNNGGQPLTWTTGTGTANVQYMNAMFFQATSFNQPLSTWNVGKVRSFDYMFRYATAFNSAINWTTIGATATNIQMEGIFSEAPAFNQPIGIWNTSNVVNMSNMFQNAIAFNQDISAWNVSHVTNMFYMFSGATAFNNGGQPLTWSAGTGTANVTDMRGMFLGASVFNQPISSWNTSNVTFFENTFTNAFAFNQNIGSWNITNVTDMVGMLNACGMSKDNYDNTLISWASQNVKPNVNLWATGLKYCAGQSARNTLITTKNWVISGDTKECPEINVKGNNNSIANGSTITSSSNHTDFEHINQNAPKERTYTIHNSSPINFIISGVSLSNTTDFEIDNSLLSSLPITILPNNTLQLKITLKSTTTGIKTSTVTIQYNPNNSLYNFAIAGRVVDYAYIPLYSDNKVSIVNSYTDTPVMELSTSRPIGVAVNPSATKVYVVNQLNKTVSVINTTTHTITKTINVGSVPRTVCFGANGLYAYVVNTMSNNISIIDAINDVEIGVIPLDRTQPLGMAVSPNGEYLYVTHQTNYISIINLATHTKFREIQATGYLTEVVFNASGTRAYVINNTSKNVLSFDTQTYALVEQKSFYNPMRGIAAPSSNTSIYATSSGYSVQRHISNVSNIGGIESFAPHTLAVTPDGTKLYVTPGGNDSYAPASQQKLGVINLSTNTTVANVPIGGTPAYCYGNMMRLNYLQAPEISISSGTAHIANNDNTPSTSDFTDWGAIGVGVTKIMEYKVHNVGTLPLTVQNVLTSNTTDFTIQDFTPNTVIGAGGSLSIKVAFMSNTTGIKNTTISIQNTDSDEGTYSFALTVKNADYVYVPNKTSGSISVINAHTNLVENTKANLPKPECIAISPDGNSIAFIGTDSFYGTKKVYAMSASSTFLVSSNIDGINGVGICFSPNGKRIYASAGGEVRIFAFSSSPVSLTYNATFSGGNGNVQGIAISPDGLRLYIAYSNGRIGVMRTSDNSLITQFDVGGSFYGVAVSPDGSKLYATNTALNSVVVVNTNTYTTISIPVQTAPKGIAITPNGTKVYVANSASNSVSVITTADNSVVHITNGNGIGNNPTGVTVRPSGLAVYVTNYDSNSVSVINTSDNSVSTITTGMGVNPNGLGNMMPLTYPPSPNSEISVLGSDIEISNGDTSPRLIDNTDFGNVAVAVSKTQSFSIYNQGTAPLAISSINLSNTTDYSLSILNSSVPIPTGGYLTFSITLNRVSTGTASCVITINNNDPDESAYSFHLVGNVVGENAYVSNYNAGQVTIVNTGTNLVTGAIFTGGAPSNICVNAEGTKAYVLDKSINKVLVLNLLTNTKEAEISSISEIKDITLTPDGRRLYIIATNLTMTMVSTISFTPITTIPTNIAVYQNFGICVSSSGKRIYITSPSNNSLYIANAVNRYNITSVQVGTNPQGIAISPNEKYVCVANAGSNNVTFVNTQTLVTTNVSVGNNPSYVAFSLDGTKVYVTNTNSNTVSILTINPVNLGTITKTDVNVGIAPKGVSVSPNGLYVYVCNSGSNNISVLKVSDNSLLAPISSVPNPQGAGNIMRIKYSERSSLAVAYTDYYGQNTEIVNGDNTPSTSEQTNFGSIKLNTNKTNTFTMFNMGSKILNITSITSSNSSDFTIGYFSPTTTTIDPGRTLSLSVTFKGNSLGTKTSTITINSNDPDNPTYTFTVIGNVTPLQSIPNPNMAGFNGTNSYVEVPDNGLLNVYTNTNAISLEYWVYPQDVTTNNQIIIAKRPVSNDGGFFVELNGNIASHNLYTNMGWVNIPVGFDANTWNHIALVGEAYSGSLKIYKNGRLINTINSTFSSFIQTEAVLRIGKDSEFASGNHWKGLLDEVRFWNIARSEHELRENMHITLTNTENGLVTYYQFDESSGDVIDALYGNNGISNNLTRATSTLTIGKGRSKVVSLADLGTADIEVQWDDVNMEIDFKDGGIAPDGDLGIYQITSQTPYNNTTMPTRTTSCYWVVQNFGNINAGLAIDTIRIRIPENDVISATDIAMPSNLKLYKRTTNSIDITWGGSAVANAVRVNNLSKEVVFSGVGVTSFSEFIVGSETSPLPITLLGLKGRRVEGLRGESTEEVRLEWATASETNNKGFEVEMSDDGLAYHKVAFVEGRGNSTSIVSYQLSTFNTQDAYYRLKQVDFDGKFSYSPIVFIEGIEGLKVFPNPNNGSFTIDLGKTSEAVTTRLLNAQGVTVWAGKLQNAQSNLNLNLPAGLYLLQTVRAGKTKTTKIVIER
ncbi:MAG: BspA family leucine-rich repeat surface protein [Bacteroidetes bacterium]|nr:MAG: BspA family leucine-rich repeat surface protein [Bacteroidota bacterium]